MNNATFRVLRAFWIGDQSHQVGEVVRLDDAGLIGTLLSANQIVPASEEGRASVRTRSLIEWNAERGNQKDETLRFRVMH